ncbi:hypothetical protein TNCV_4013571 [Trichonephila clavipes]|nr:hypothetical protein TNCV_4013571 [Trichonephila clavipes]
MANCQGCPCFPKPPKGTAKINRNSYTKLYNSFVISNFSHSQITSNTNNNAEINNKTKELAPRRPEISRQTEAISQNPPIQASNLQMNLNAKPILTLTFPTGITVILKPC